MGGGESQEETYIRAPHPVPRHAFTHSPRTWPLPRANAASVVMGPVPRWKVQGLGPWPRRPSAWQVPFPEATAFPPVSFGPPPPPPSRGCPVGELAPRPWPPPPLSPPSQVPPPPELGWWVWTPRSPAPGTQEIGAGGGCLLSAPHGPALCLGL